MNTGPYVSFVTFGRNDGYTPGYVRRVNRSITCLANQLEEARLASEIVFSERNPPPHQPLLIDLLEVPRTLVHVSLRGAVVPPDDHQRSCGSVERGIHPA